MDNSDPLNEMRRLRGKIVYLNDAYYNKSTSHVNDDEFDAMKRRLRVLEEELGIDDPTSPTNTVGAPVQHGGHFPIVKHHTPMYSLANAYTEEDLKAWLDTLPLEATVSSEPKVDGLSIDLYYLNGGLIRAITRGDGWEGEDVTQNIEHVWGVQTNLGHTNPPMGIVEVRGEIYVSKKMFEKINGKLIEAGKKSYANARNYASGSLRLKNPDEVKERHLSFVAYDYFTDIQPYADAPREKQMLFWGFDYAVAEELDKSRRWMFLGGTLDKMLEGRHGWRYEIDGMVFKVDQPQLRRQMGERLNSPRWAIAYKFPADTGQTMFVDTQWQVGKSGVVTPVALISPIKLCGVTITNVTLHNVAEIERLDLKVADEVIVSRRGDVIPKIERVVVGERTGCESPIVYPIDCPSCGEKLTRLTHSLYCTNNSGCPDQAVARVIHFASRKGMNIKGLGDVAIKELVRHGLVISFSALFYLRNEDLAVGIKSEKTRQKVLRNIASAKTRPFSRVLFAIGIPEVGEGTAERLAEHYDNLEQLCQATQEELQLIPDIGEVVSESIVANCAINRKEYLAYDRLFTYVKEQVVMADEQDLLGKTVVVTGNGFDTLDGRKSRSEMEKDVKARGAKLVSGVSANVDYIYAGDGAGPQKLKDATALGFEFDAELKCLVNPAKESINE